jgi:hypothetical protein
MRGLDSIECSISRPENSISKDSDLLSHNALDNRDDPQVEGTHLFRIFDAQHVAGNLY